MTEINQENEVYVCPWCHVRSDVTRTSCFACGAPIDVTKIVSLDNWTKLPAVKDRTTIQLKHSYCQIEGAYVPIADFNLAEGEGFYFPRHLILWKDNEVKLGALPFSLTDLFKRFVAGLPLVIAEAIGPGRIAVSRDSPGELIALPVRKGQSYDVRENIFMLATHSVQYNWLKSRIWFTTGMGKERKTFYPIGVVLDRFTAENEHGFLLLHGSGNVFMRQLAPEESILIKPTSFLLKESSVRMHLHFEYPAQNNSWFGGSSWERYTWIRLIGPGRVAIQSHSGVLEGQSDVLTDAEPKATKWRW